MKFLSDQFVDVIDWTEQPGELAIRYPLADRAMTNGTQLTVREGQVAVFHDEGQVADVFGPGRHVLETSNLPILTALLNWDKGFVSPFKSDLYFFTTKEQSGLTWGTSQPVTVRDRDLGPFEIRAFGRYSFCVAHVAFRPA
jgi:membrane protease subunit (stomatin/prohibitin family)